MLPDSNCPGVICVAFWTRITKGKNKRLERFMRSSFRYE